MKRMPVALAMALPSAAATGLYGLSLIDLAPIGKTAKGELIYSMKCDNLPAPPAPAPPPQAEVREAAPPPEPEVRRTGLFGWSYDRRKPDE